MIILGSGASAAHGVPSMGALAAHLTSAAPPAAWTAEENKEWNAFLAHLKAAGTDLESALQAVRPTERQTHFIASATREFLLPSDLAALSALLADRYHLPLSRLCRHHFDSTQTTLHVVMPNYDRLAEYAADAADVSTFTGFNYGYLQSRARDPRTRITIRGRETRSASTREPARKAASA